MGTPFQPQPPAFQPQPGAPAAFKSQPWTLFDTIASKSFLLGDERTGFTAAGGGPAITANGEIVFFQSSNRTKATMPWYTNADAPGTLSYGLKVWQVYLIFMFPTWPPAASVGSADATQESIVPGTIKLIECILNFGVLQLDLGQETQTEWPCSRFAAGGGLAQTSFLLSQGQNGMPFNQNVMSLPEPIEMPRTQVMNVKIKLAPPAQAMIGNPSALPASGGVGTPLFPYNYTVVPADGEDPAVINLLPELPFAIQIGLQGERVKDTQYGQVVR